MWELVFLIPPVPIFIHLRGTAILKSLLDKVLMFFFFYFWYKYAVVRYCTNKWSQFFFICRFWHLFYSFHYFWVGFYSCLPWYILNISSLSVKRYIFQDSESIIIIPLKRGFYTSFALVKYFCWPQEYGLGSQVNQDSNVRPFSMSWAKFADKTVGSVLFRCRRPRPYFSLYISFEVIRLCGHEFFEL